MSAMITTKLKERLAENMANDPLKPGEFRRIKGLGGHYISLESKRGEQEWMFQIDINGEDFYIFHLVD